MSSLRVCLHPPSTSAPGTLPDLAPRQRRQPAQLSERGNQICERRVPLLLRKTPLLISFPPITSSGFYRSPERQRPLNFATSAGRIAYWLGVVRRVALFSTLWHFLYCFLTPKLCKTPSWYSADIPFRPRGFAQHPGDRPVGAQPRGLVRYVRAQIHDQDGVHGCAANGASSLGQLCVACARCL